MALYNRLRVIDMASAHYGRDAVSARAACDPIFNPMGGRYGGYCIEQGSRCHFYIIDEPTDEQIARVLSLSRKTPLSLIREYRGMNPVPYDVATIIADIAKVVKFEMFMPEAKMLDLARCWSGVKVLEHLSQGDHDSSV